MSSLNILLGKIAVIGAGKMGEAIISGMVNKAKIDPEQIVVVEPNIDICKNINTSYRVSTCLDSSQISNICEIESVVVAIKPQVLRDVCGKLVTLRGFAPKRVISIAAGVTTTTLGEIFINTNIIRVMPNIALSANYGMCAVSIGAGSSQSDGELVADLFATMGKAILIDEGMINAVTAISGSGPAYFALLAEELEVAAVKLGLDPKDAKTLAKQTFVGSAATLQKTDLEPAELRQAVTSPGGTTAAALACFKDLGFSDMVFDAANAAVLRAEELA